MKEIIAQLQRIAKANGDSFKYHIDIFPSKEPIFEFVVEEDEDNHIFIQAQIENLEKVDISQQDLIEACNVWDYKYVN